MKDFGQPAPGRGAKDSPSVASTPVDTDRLGWLPAEKRYNAWLALIFRRVDASTAGSGIRSARLAQYADALIHLPESEQVPAAQFLLHFVNDFYATSGAPGQLSNQIGAVFNGMTNSTSAIIFVEALLNHADSHFPGKQHLVTWGVTEHIGHFSKEIIASIERRVLTWAIAYHRPQDRFDLWTSTMPKLEALTWPAASDIAMFGNAITEIPAAAQTQRQDAVNRLAAYLLNAAKLREISAAFQLTRDSLLALKDVSIRADLAAALMDTADETSMAFQPALHSALLERLDLFGPATGFVIRERLSQLAEAVNSARF
ncbi:hypothetical protein [Pandoraea aquatica]|uniref:hypothetical protein n=1 Tax=Pandoraea aquatica TaxID=2508290 RepID=UPI0012418A96|nr:hypothetical protein [Pandoraea aquatica]